MTWVVYMIQTSSGKLYTGITTDLKRRFQEHRKRKKGARFFHLSRAEEIVFVEGHPNRSAATKREIAIKKMKRHEKLALISKCVVAYQFGES